MKKGYVLLALTIIPLLTHAKGTDVDFRDTDINVFIDAVSQATHTSIISPPQLSGKVSFKGNDLSQKDYLDMFRVILRAKGYSVLQIGDILKIVPEKERNSIYEENNDNTSPGQLVTRTLQLNTLPVTEIISQLNALSGGNGNVTLSGMNSGNILMLSGYADEVQRLEQLAKKIDNQQGRDSMIVPLHHASSEELSRTVTNLIANGDFNRGTLKATVVADNRTNSLIINGSDQEKQKLKSLITQLDSSSEFDNEDGVVYLKYTKADAIEKVIGKLIKGKDSRFIDISVVAVPEINAVIISAAKEKMTEITRLVHQLDVRRAQVHVEAMIVEVAEGDQTNFGVQWGNKDGSLMQFTNGSQIPLGVLQAAQQQAKSQSGSTVVSENGSTTINPDSQGDLSALMGLLSTYNGGAVSIVKGDWMTLVQALKTNSKSNILSTPSITTLDNQSASFMVGQNVPILTGSTASSDNKTPFQTVERRDVGTKLTIVPQINEGEAVQLKISAEVSKIEGNTGLDVTFAERKLDTSVLVNDGSMLVLGGLIDQQKDSSESKVPILGDIPFIGRLFSSTASQNQKRNLMIFIRPTIIRDGLSADGITQNKYGYIRAQQIIDDQEKLNGDIGQKDSASVGEISAFNEIEFE